MIDTPVQTPISRPAILVSPAERPSPPVDLIAATPPAWLGRTLRWLFPIAVLLFIALIVIPGFLQKWLWMRQLDYASIFWTLVSVKVALTCAAFAFSLLFLWLNLREASRSRMIPADRNTARARDSSEPPSDSSLQTSVLVRHIASRSKSLLTAIVAAIFASGFYTQWDTYLRFRYGESFGIADPIFRLDLGFYMFRLPWYELLQSSLVIVIVLSIIAVGIQYAYVGFLRFSNTRSIEVTDRAARHLSILFLILVGTFGWGFYLDRFELLYSTTGVVHGMGYTTDHATLPALWVMIGLSLAACAFLALNAFRPRLKAVVIGAAMYIGVYILGILIVPALVQKFVVQPNELSIESPYLRNYIALTRKAYKLDSIQETAYPAMADLTPAVLARNQDTIQNIRLWDKRPLLQTYQQTQAIRLYYKFYSVDVDRYHLADGYHQVMLSTRELSPHLPTLRRKRG